MTVFADDETLRDRHSGFVERESGSGVRVSISIGKLILS